MSDASFWQTDKKEYDRIHSWLHYKHGSANKCDNTDCPATTKQYDWANLSGKYKRDLSDWEQLCRSCHRTKDYGNKCRKLGHPMTEDNVYIAPKTGARYCKQCRAITQRRYREKKYAK